VKNSGVALIGYGFYKQDPNQRPFSLTDPNISFPFAEHETVSTATLILVSVLAPAVIIILGAALLIPGTATVGGTKASKSQLLRRKFWEWNAGWMGLALALAGAWMATQGLKTLMGKPRPDLLARCDPDVRKIADYAVGGLGERLVGAPILVDWKICLEQGYNLRVDGFSSFPSGHSSRK
jgi:membrane-associated phospholipid phosphatase